MSLQKAKAIISEKMHNFEQLKDLFKNNTGYIGKFTEYLFNSNITIEDIKQTYNDILELKDSNKPINVYKYDTYESLIDDIIKTKNDILVKRLINQFPSKQKVLIEDLIKTPKNYLTTLKVSKMEDISAFISKISRYDNKSDLISALELFSKDVDNSKETILSKLEKTQSDIVVNKNDIIIVEIKSFQDLVDVASDTSWCILRESTFKDYTSNGQRQFIIFDYNKEYDTEFKIGFTINNRGGYRTAHDILDNYIREENLSKILSIVNVSISSLFRGNVKYDTLSISKEIDGINRKTKVSSIKMISEMICYDKDLSSKLLNKLIFVYDINSENEYIKNISRPKTDIIKDIISNLFNDIEVVNESDLININSELPLIYDSLQTNIIKGYKNPYTIKESYIYGSSYVDKVIESYLYCNDVAILKVIKYGYDYMLDSLSYRKKTNDYLRITKEHVLIIINRLLKSKNKDLLACGILLHLTINDLSYRKSIKDYREVISNTILKSNSLLSEYWFLFDGNNDFDFKLDLSNNNVLNNFVITNQNIHLIEKKDYFNNIYDLYEYEDHYDIVNNLLSHLDGFETTLKVYLDSDSVSGYEKLSQKIENNDLKTILQRITSPEYIKKPFEKEGKVTIILK